MFFTYLRQKSIFMKKIIYLCLAFCMTTTLAFSQKVTKENLQGNWKIVAIDILNSEGIYIDLIKEEVEFSENIKSQATDEELNMVKTEFKGTMEMLKQTTMSIDSDSFTMTVGTDLQKGKYNLAEKDGKQIILLTFDNGIEDNARTYFKDNLFYIDTTTDGIFVYKKV